MSIPIPMPAATTTLPIPPKPKDQSPHIFGRGMRDRLLILLAVNDRPVYVTELAAALKSDDRKVRNTLAVLTDLGIVASAHSGAMNIRYVGLNPRFPAYPPLLRFLRVLERQHPQPRLGKPARTAERLALRGIKPVGPSRLANLDRLFYSPPRTRTLLTIAAMGSTDVRDIHATVGLDHRSVWNVVNHWQREGIVRSVVVGRRRALELDPTYPAAAELKRFLRRLIAVTGEYEGIAQLSTRRPEGIRFTATR